MLRKKELMALPELIGGQDEERAVIIARAEIAEIGDNRILHIDVSESGKVILRYFADRPAKRWLCYGQHSGWSQMGLGSAVDFELSRGDFVGYSWGNYRLYRIQSKPEFDRESSNTVEQYLWGQHSRWAGDTGWKISQWEIECRDEKRELAVTRHRNRINELMDRVPALPDDFEDWLKKEIFPDDFLYVRKQGGKTEYICTACGKTGKRSSLARVGEETVCPRCGRAVKVRSRNRKYKAQTAAVVLLQTATMPRDRKDPLKGLFPEHDVYVERQMTVECRPLEGRKELRIYEHIRAVVPKGEHWGNVYYGEFADGTPEHQFFRDTNPMNRRWKMSYLYPNNLGEVLPAAGMEHSGIDILARKKVPVNVDYFIVKYPSMTWIEYLIKAGLYRLVQDIVNNSWGYSGESVVRTSGRSLQECLMLDAAGVNRLKQLNGGRATLEWLRVEKKTGRRISQESLEFLTVNRISPWENTTAKMLKAIGSPNRMANYLKKQMEKTGSAASTVLSTWHDYMDMCRRLNKQTDAEIVYKPKDVNLAHDECLALLKREDAGKRAAEVRKKFPEAEPNLQLIADKYNFGNDEYLIIVPENIEDIIVEGSTLGHCIDRTDIYFERIQNRTSYLVFLRKAERPEAPWYTLEIEPGGTIRQKRTVGNTQRNSDIKAFTPFLREWQKYVLRRMNREDKELAQASKEARLEEYGQLRVRKEPIRNGLLKGQLLADVLEADLMEAM